MQTAYKVCHIFEDHKISPLRTKPRGPDGKFVDIRDKPFPLDFLKDSRTEEPGPSAHGGEDRLQDDVEVRS